MGVFGTDIADNFANRIFEVFSSHKDYITLSEYLKYIDVYHYGNKVERCKVTCKLMDFSNTGIIKLKDFKKYIELIIGAVKKVNPGLKSDLFDDEDISILFNKISNNRDYFTYEDFNTIYNDKPEILSWIDYFKNDSNEFILVIHQYIKKLIKVLYNFHVDMFNTIEQEIKNGNGYNNFNPNYLLKNVRNIINNMQKEIKKYDKEFLKHAKFNQFSLRNLFDNLSENGIESDLSDNESESEESEKKDDLINTNKINDIRASNLSILNHKDGINLFFENLKKKINDDNYDDNIEPPDLEEDEISYNFQYTNTNDKKTTVSKKSNLSKNNILNEEDDKIIIEEKKSSDSDDEIIEDDDYSDLIANIQALNKGNQENKFIKTINRTLSKEKENGINKKTNDLIHNGDNNLIKNNKEEKKRDKTYKNIFKCIEFFCKKISKSIFNIDESYSWIEKHYLKNKLKEIERIKLEKKSKIKKKKKNYLQIFQKTN